MSTIDDVEVEAAFAGNLVVLRTRRTRRHAFREVHLDAQDAMGVANRLRDAALRAFPAGKLATFSDKEDK